MRTTRVRRRRRCGRHFANRQRVYLDKRIAVDYRGGVRQELARSTPAAGVPDRLRSLIQLHWGIRTLRPQQERAMRAVLDRRDSLVVLPTGGGKSLCYQAPPLFRQDTTVVVSPLIALMKDQVDGLQASGIPAIQIDS